MQWHSRARAQLGAINLSHANGEHDHEHEHEHEKEKEQIQKYTCPMHPEVVTEHPGNCPKCGMKLVPMKEKKHSTSTRDKSHRSRHTLQRIGASVAYAAIIALDANDIEQPRLHTRGMKCTWKCVPLSTLPIP